MRNRKNVKSSSLRQKLLMLYHQDGILEMLVAVSILMLSIVMAFEAVPFIGLIGIPLILYIPIKDQVAIPRIGAVHFEPEAASRRKLWVLLLAGAGVLLAFLTLNFMQRGASGGLSQFISRNEILVFATLLSAVLAAAGLILRNRNLLVYAVLEFVLILLLNSLGIRIWIAVAGLSLLMGGIAVYKLFIFLKTHPIQHA